MLFDPGCPGCGCEDPDSVKCGSCDFPKKDLKLAASNSFMGPTTATMTFDGVGSWSTGCVSGLIYKLTCVSGVLKFSVTYFFGSCPSGTPSACSTPTSLGIYSTVCSPLFLDVRPTSCSVVSSSGYTKFVVTE